MNTQLLVHLFWADEVALWFVTLEMRFETFKFKTVISNIGKPHMRLVRDIVAALPETGKYDFLKSELIKRLGESDANRIRPEKPRHALDIGRLCTCRLEKSSTVTHSAHPGLCRERKTRNAD